MFAQIKKKIAKNKLDPVVIPAKIKVKSDTVSFTTIDNKTEKKFDYANQACYGGFMASLPNYLFICKPCGGFSIDNNDYLKWMSLCHKNNLLPISSEYYIEKDKPYAKIPGGNVSKHLIYTALCCYRFAESVGPLVYSVVRLTEEKPKLDFFQILYYAMSKYAPTTGHNFSYMCTASLAFYGKNKNSRIDLCHSIGMKWFFAPDEMGDSEASKAKTTGATNDTLHSYCTKIDVKIPIKDPSLALLAKYTPLYKVEAGDTKSLKKLAENIDK